MTERKPQQLPPPTMADRIGNVVDSVVSVFAPETGARRQAFRVASRVSRAVRNAASDAGRNDQTRADSWLSSRLSPDSALELDLDTQRRKSRELYLNDTIGGAVDSRMNLVVSYGFTPQAKITERKGLCSKAEAEQYNEELEEVYERLYPRIGKDGKTSLWQQLQLVERHNGFDGESFTIMSDRGEADKPVPLCTDVIDPERVETPPDKIGNPRIRMGIEYDAGGKIVAYHVRDAHPGDTVDVKQTYTRYDAWRVLHVYEKWFAGQSRAYPWLVRAINRCKDGKDLDEATIINAQIAACFAAFEIAPPGLGGVAGAVGAATGTSGNYRTQEIRPGTIRHIDGLGQGGDIKFATPPSFNGYETFQEHNDRRIAAGLNWPYEMTFKKWVGLSFAAGRLSLAEAKLFVKAQQKRLRECWLAAIWNRMVEEAVVVGACSIRPAVYSKAPWWFQKHAFTDPAWPFALTPGEEIDAAITAVDNNIRTKASLVAEYGGNWEDVARERAAERELERSTEIEPASAEVPDAQLTPQKMEAVGAK